MIEVPLTQGKVALIDDEDNPLVSKYKWQAHRDSKANNTYYATTTIRRSDGKRTTLQMHNLILGCKRVDHKDNNGLNNQRSNLRPATHSQNGANTGTIRNKSGFKGVCFERDRWRAAIRVEGRLIFLGYFNTPKSAARAYDYAARIHFGDFARLNFPDQGTEVNNVHC